MISWSAHFGGWVKKRKIRLAIKREIEILQISAADLYLNKNSEKLSDEDLEVVVSEYEEIISKIEEHITFLAITKKIN